MYLYRIFHFIFHTSSWSPRILHPYIHADKHGPGYVGALYKNSIHFFIKLIITKPQFLIFRLWLNTQFITCLIFTLISIYNKLIKYKYTFFFNHYHNLSYKINVMIEMVYILNCIINNIMVMIEIIVVMMMLTLKRILDFLFF